jgi:hypothetical protein
LLNLFCAFYAFNQALNAFATNRALSRHLKIVQLKLQFILPSEFSTSQAKVNVHEAFTMLPIQLMASARQVCHA